MNEILGLDDMSGEDLLGRVRRKIAAKRKVKKGLARLKALALLKAKRKGKATPPKAPAPPKRSVAKKPVLRSIWARLTPAKRKALMAAAIKKNPKLKRKLVLAMVKKRINERKNGLVTSPGDVDTTPVPSKSPAVIMPNPAQAAVPEEEGKTDAQAVEEEMDQSALDEGGDAEAENAEAAEDAAEDTAAERAENAEADAEEMTEETPEEAAEEAAEATDDAAESVAESAGDLLLGFFKGKRKLRRRHMNHIRRCVNAAKPLAGEVERLSGGEIQAAHLLGAVKLIAKAKKGDVKAKKGIKAVTKIAAKKGPKAKKAKKAVAKLKIAHKIMKKTGTAKGTGKKKAKIVAKKKAAPYSKKVVVRNQGLSSYSPYQRGMAMIPGFARAHFGTKG